VVRKSAKKVTNKKASGKRTIESQSTIVIPSVGAKDVHNTGQVAAYLRGGSAVVEAYDERIDRWGEVELGDDHGVSYLLWVRDNTPVRVLTETRVYRVYEKGRPWRAETNGTYFFVSEEGNVEQAVERRSGLDGDRWRALNYFQHEKRAVEYARVSRTLRRHYAIELDFEERR
jgi:hypothetical protein